MFRQSHPPLSMEEMQLLEDMLPSDHHDLRQPPEQDLNHELFASLHQVMAAYQAFAADGASTGHPFPGCQQPHSKQPHQLLLPPTQQSGRKSQQHKAQHDRKRQHRQRHEPGFPQHPYEGVGNQHRHHDLFQPDPQHFCNPEGLFLDAAAAPQLCNLEGLQEPSSYGACAAAYAAMAACCTAAATALPPYTSPTIGATNHMTGLQLVMPSINPVPNAACEGQASAVLPPTQHNGVVSMRPPSLCLDMVTKGMPVPGYAAVPETGLAKSGLGPAHLQGQPQASSSECDISNIPITPSGQFLMDLLSSLKKRMDPSSSNKSPFKDIQEAAGAVGQSGAPGAFANCFPSEVGSGNLAQGGLPLLKRSPPDASAFEQLLQTAVLVKDLYSSAGQQSDFNVFGLISPRSPGQNKARRHKHIQNSRDLPAGALHNRQRRTPVDGQPKGPGGATSSSQQQQQQPPTACLPAPPAIAPNTVGPASSQALVPAGVHASALGHRNGALVLQSSSRGTTSKLPSETAGSFDEHHAALHVKPETAVCQPCPCMKLDGQNSHDGQPNSRASPAVGVPAANTLQLSNCHLPHACAAGPGGLVAETEGVQDVLAGMGVPAGDQGLMSSMVSGQPALLAAVAAKLAATPASPAEGLTARVQGSQQIGSTPTEGALMAPAAAVHADQQHNQNPAKERQKHMVCLDLRSPGSKLAAAGAALQRPPEGASTLHHAPYAARPFNSTHAVLGMAQQQAACFAVPSSGAAAVVAAEVVKAPAISACQLINPQAAAAHPSLASFKAGMTATQGSSQLTANTPDAAHVASNAVVSGSQGPMHAPMENKPPATPEHAPGISKGSTAGPSVTASGPGRPGAESTTALAAASSPASEAAHLLLGLSAGQHDWVGKPRCQQRPPQQQQRRRKAGSSTFAHLPPGSMIDPRVELPVQHASAASGSTNTNTSYKAAQQQVITAAASFMHSLGSIQTAAFIPGSLACAPSLPSSAAGVMQQQQQQPLPGLAHLASALNSVGKDPDPTGATHQHMQTALPAPTGSITGMQDLAAALIAAAAAANNAATAPSATNAPSAGMMQPFDTLLQGPHQQLPLKQQQPQGPAAQQPQQPNNTDGRMPGSQVAAQQQAFRRPKRKSAAAAPAASSAAPKPDDVLQFLSGQGSDDVDSAALVRIALGLRPLKDRRSSLSGGGSGGLSGPQACSGPKGAAAMTAAGRVVEMAQPAEALWNGGSKKANVSAQTPDLPVPASTRPAPSHVFPNQPPEPVAAASVAEGTISKEASAAPLQKQPLQAAWSHAICRSRPEPHGSADTADAPINCESPSASDRHQEQLPTSQQHNSKQLLSEVQSGPPPAAQPGAGQASGLGLRSRTAMAASKTAAQLDDCPGKSDSRASSAASGRQQGAADSCGAGASVTTAIPPRPTTRRHSCKLAGRGAEREAEPSGYVHERLASTRQQLQRRHSLPASTAAPTAVAGHAAELVASSVGGGHLPPRRAAARAAAVTAAAVAAAAAASDADDDDECLIASHSSQEQTDRAALGSECNESDEDAKICRTQRRGKGRASASGGAASSARQKRGKLQLPDGARYKRARLSSAPSAAATTTATAAPSAGGAVSDGGSSGGDSGDPDVDNRVLANRLAAARSYLRKKEETARLEVTTANLKVERTAGQQKLQLVEDLLEVHAQLQVLLQDHADTPASQLFPADAVEKVLQCKQLGH